MANTPLESQIVAVTVYTDRARVTRRGVIDLAAGEHELVLASLPLAVQPDSVRASGHGTGVRILGVDVQQQYVTQSPDEDQAALAAQVQALQDQDQALADEEAGLAERESFLKTVRQEGAIRLARGLGAGQASIEGVEALAQYLAREQATIAAWRRDLAAQRRTLAREITALQGRAGGRPDPSERRQIVVGIEAAEDTQLELDVVYGVTGASWEPLYDVRLGEAGVTLTYLANVRQQTGEDWPAVQLALSTARPAVTTTIPELDPWYIDVYRAPNLSLPSGGAAYASMPMSAPMQQTERYAPGDDADEGWMPRKRKEVAEVAQATVESSGAAVTYHVARPAAVPSDGSPHKTTVSVIELPAQLDYITIPKLAEEAYLRATVKNTSAFILLPGPANIFHGADFVGTTRLDTVVPNEEFEAQLGVDDRVKVEHELVARTVGRAALFGNHTRTEWGYKITLTNHLLIPARVTVYDQVPVSRHTDIKPKLVEASPPPTEQSDLNILKWVGLIAPQKQQVITFAFQVEYPTNLTVAGLPQ